MTEQNYILPVVAYEHEILRTVCTETENNEATQIAIKSLIATMGGYSTGVGLAAPQINMNSRMFVMKSGGRLLTIINPIIKKKRGEIKLSDEGCLSIPNVYESIPGRCEIIDLEFYDENFNKKRITFRGFEAIIVQHEFDHLNGVMFIDYLSKEGREKIADQLSDIEKGIMPTVIKEMILKDGSIYTPVNLK